jgi:RNA polymerase sigma-70 factor (ECF subfamily)
MAEHDETIDALVERAARGDHVAFGGLYDAYAERLYRFVRFRVRDPFDAEDVVQRIFLKVIEALPRYEARGTPFAAWLFRLARNAVIDHVRAQRPVEPLGPMSERVAALRDPEQVALARLEMDEVAVALATLTTEQRDVIAYRFFAGLTPAEIGQIMGKREGSIRALQFRALAALRAQLPADEGRRATTYRPEVTS